VGETKSRVLDERANWRHLANAVELLCAAAISGSSTRGGDATCSQIAPGSLLVFCCQPYSAQYHNEYTAKRLCLARRMDTLCTFQTNYIIGSYSVTAFSLHITLHCPISPKICLLPWWKDLEPHLIHGFLDHPTHNPKRHPDRASRFLTVQAYARYQTDRPAELDR